MTTLTASGDSSANAYNLAISNKFILGFLVMCLVIGMTGGEEVLTWFLVIVLVSMILLNTSAFTKVISIFNSSATTLTTV